MKHYEELRDALATGAAEIAFKDKRVRYKGSEDMKRLLAEMEAELGLAGSSQSTPQARVPRFDNGL
ncbi:MAG: hypothetical protein AAFZ87_07055 [Planctomycetota bacterium]